MLRFSRNTGAIIGIAVAGTIFLIIAVFIIFFTCSRYKSRQIPREIDELPRWRSPLAGDDESQNFTRNPIASASQTSEMTRHTLGSPEQIVVYGRRASTERTCIESHDLGRRPTGTAFGASEVAFSLPSRSHASCQHGSHDTERLGSAPLISNSSQDPFFVSGHVNVENLGEPAENDTVISIYEDQIPADGEAALRDTNHNRYSFNHPHLYS